MFSVFSGCTPFTPAIFSTHQHALVHRLVGEPGRAGEVADGVDAGLAGAAALVDHDVGLLDLHLGAFEAEILDVADDADGAR